MRTWGVVGHVQAMGTDFQRDRHGFRPQRLHQMRSDLGRLDAIAEILQIGPLLSRKRARLASRSAQWYIAGKMQGASHMRVFGIAAVIVLLTGLAYAQVTPNVNLIPELQSKTPEEKEQEAAQQKAYKESLKKIPDAKASSDPWGTVRSVDTPKTSAPAKPRTKTGSTAN